MKLQTKKKLDWYVGGLAMGILTPWVRLLGRILKRNHALEVRDSICFIKMLGGGSLIIAYPALFGLRRKYPDATFSLICLRGIKPFAESLGVFDRIDEIDESSLLRLVKSGFRCVWRNFLVDTVVDLEVYSRLTTVLSSLTCARNRIGFYFEAVFWRKPLHTHLIYFNRSSGTFHWYDAIARLLGTQQASVKECQKVILKRVTPIRKHGGLDRRIAIGHCCSDLGRERMLNEQEWLSVFEQNVERKDKAEILLLGNVADRDLGEKIISRVSQSFPSLQCENFCGELSLIESVGMLSTCHEFWGIDSALLHYARLLGLKCISFWGPTDPATRLRPMPELDETVHYTRIPCSPCIHVAEEPPCRGNNVCIRSLFDGANEYDSISWLA